MRPRERLYALEQFGIKLGLENIAALLAALSHPEQSWPAVHVAGTNGKGSVTAMVERGLRAAGHRTGRYTSPHLDRIEERMAIDGEPVDAQLFDRLAADVLAIVDRLLREGGLEAPPTFFEATTAMAFELFRRARVSVAVVEVGLGGRFDATNVLHPFVSVITSIAFDHERHLGDTIPAIAGEKAGIIKPGVPVVVGELPAEAHAVMAAKAYAVGAPLHLAGRELIDTSRLTRGRVSLVLRTAAGRYPPVTLALKGGHQLANAVVAARTLEMCHASGLTVRAADVVTALSDVDWPGRLEWLRTSGHQHVLLDAAHNPAGARALAQYLEDAGVSRLPIVIAVMKDKDVEGMIEPLARVASLFVATEAATDRSLTTEALAQRIGERVSAVPVLAGGAADDALARAQQRSDRVVVTGSLYLVGPLRARLVASGAVPEPDFP